MESERYRTILNRLWEHGPNFGLTEQGALESFFIFAKHAPRQPDLIYILDDERGSVAAFTEQEEIAEAVLGERCLGVIVYPGTDIIPWVEWKAHKARWCNKDGVRTAGRKTTEEAKTFIDKELTGRNGEPFSGYEKGLVSLLESHPDASAIDLVLFLARMLDSDVQYIKGIIQVAQKQRAQARVFSALENLKSAIKSNDRVQQTKAEHSEALLASQDGTGEGL